MLTLFEPPPPPSLKETPPASHPNPIQPPPLPGAGGGERGERGSPQGKRPRQRRAPGGCLKNAIFIVLLLLFLERFLALWTLGVHYTLASDDLSYIKSGIRFAQTGMVTMHGTTPSAQSMPGMTWFIGLFAWILGDGTALWWALKLT